LRDRKRTTRIRGGNQQTSNNFKKPKKVKEDSQEGKIQNYLFFRRHAQGRKIKKGKEGGCKKQLDSVNEEKFSGNYGTSTNSGASHQGNRNPKEGKERASRGVLSLGGVTKRKEG